MKEAVVFTCCKNGQVLAEKRLASSDYAPGEIVFPGGHIDTSDASVIQAFYREIHEELGIKPTVYYRQELTQFIERDLQISLFVVLGWLGNIPDHILDEGNPLIWEDIEVLQQSQMPDTSLIASIIRPMVWEPKHLPIHTR